jgi:endoglucanase
VTDQGRQLEMMQSCEQEQWPSKLGRRCRISAGNYSESKHVLAALAQTEVNLASGDLAKHLPAWLWGHSKHDRWEVLDSNSASDADLWMAYIVLEAGQAWNDPRYTTIGIALAKKISADEVVQVPELGMVLLPAPRGFHSDDSYRLNTSYMPVQLLLRLSHVVPDGPWAQMVAGAPGLLVDCASHGFCHRLD